MPVAEPIIERIAEDIRAALAQIKATAGYFTNATVQRFKAGGNEEGDAKIVVAMGNPTQLEQSGQLTDWEWPFEIEAVLIDQETTVTNATPETRINRLWCDIVRALNEDHTRGGLAYETDCEQDPPVFFADGVVVTALIRFKHDRGNPAQATQ